MQVDTRAIAAEFADREMMADATSTLEPEDFDVAVERTVELFDSAPWLAGSDSNIPGCMHMTYRDLFALLVIAKDRD